MPCHIRYAREKCFRHSSDMQAMGHADIRMTANIYGHLDTARNQVLADKLSSCLSPTQTRKKFERHFALLVF